MIVMKEEKIAEREAERKIQEEIREVLQEKRKTILTKMAKIGKVSKFN
jgi:hypothetical protein